MKIYKLSRVLSIIPAGVLIFMLYKLFMDNNYPHFPWATIPAIMLALFYLFSPQIDYWWFDKNPIALDPQIITLLKTTNPIYDTLDDARKKKFDKRIFLYVEGMQFMSKGHERDVEVVFDVKNMIAQVPVTMTINQKDFLLDKFEHIILYKHAFPSPKHKFLHTAETDAEDGVIIISFEHAEHAFLSPTQFYNVAYHAYAEAYVKSYPSKNYPVLKDDIWLDVEQITGFTKQQILSTLGFEKVDVLYVLITIYFTHRDNMLHQLPDLCTKFDKLFS